ncbi:apolipoprotein N-acyltransferase [Gammaproteobacteria bacterium]|nr:apolipoprotein N-acyltransferase [Gammaproteobacteria bacterium]
MRVKCLFAVISGSLFALGFAPFSLWPLSLFSVCVLMHLMEGMGKKESFIIGFLYGVGYWLIGISWVFVSIHYHGNINELSSSLITLLFISCLSVYMGLFGVLYSYLSFESTKSTIIVFPICWGLIEILRGILFTGFPWLLAGTTISDTVLGGWISVIGSQGNSIVLMIFCGALYALYKEIKNSDPLLYSSLIIGFIIVSSFVLKPINWTTPSHEIPVSVYQPNLTLEEKWSYEGIAQTQKMFESSIKEALESELIVFPETALIQSRDEIEEWLQSINETGKSKDISLLTGIIARSEDDRANNLMRNRIMGLGSASGSYDKQQLVPFGEFIPLERFLGKLLDLMGLKLTNTVPGDQFSHIKSTILKISPSICYEIAYPGLINQSAGNSNILVTISNDTWFGSSIGPEQHLQLAKDRVLEHQKPLLRSTNSGISAIIDHRGNILGKQEYFEEKTLKGRVVLQEGNTPYNHLGNSILYFYITIMMVVSLLINRNKV